MHSKTFRATRRARFINELEASGLHDVMARWGEGKAAAIAQTAGDESVRRTEAEELIGALAGECAFRIGRAMRVLYPTTVLTRSQRDRVVESATEVFAGTLRMLIEAAVPLTHIMDEARDDEESFADVMDAIRKASADARAATEAKAAAGAADSPWQPIHPRAEETSPSEAPDAGKADVAHAAAQEAAMAAAADPDNRGGVHVHRFDESGEFPAAPQRIASPGEIG